MSETSVLLVDDEPDFLSALAERLRLRELHVDTATSGMAALDLVEERGYDAVLLDVAMPVMDGIETLERLLEKRPDLQVIVLTGRATLAQGVAVMKAGALELVEKPADLEELVSLVEVAARRRAELADQRVQERMREITRKKGW